MTAPSAQARKPVILTVDDDPAVSRAVARDLRRHYGERYRIVRAESPVLDAAGTPVGRVLSGTLSPILNEAIGSALINTAAAKDPLQVDIRGTKLNLQLVKPPFVTLKKS